jgi:hypothetical protein
MGTICEFVSPNDLGDLLGLKVFGERRAEPPDQLFLGFFDFLTSREHVFRGVSCCGGSR